MLKLGSSLFMLIVWIALNPTLGAQVALFEDFSAANGLNSPLGWQSTTSGSMPAAWRFDNPGVRPFLVPFSGKQAIVDCPNNGPGTQGISLLQSPSINLNGLSQIQLSFNEQLRDNKSGRWIEVFDGSIWNTIFSRAANGLVSQDVGYLMPLAGTTVSTSFDITAASGAAANAKVRFAFHYGDDFWWALDNIKVEQPLYYDLELVSIDSPTAEQFPCVSMTGAQVLRGTLRNQGTQTIPSGTTFPAQIRVNGGAPTTFTLTTPQALSHGQSYRFNAPLPVILPAPGPNQFGVAVALPGDINPSNDIKMVTVPVALPAASFTLPYSENFDSTSSNGNVPPAGWHFDLSNGSAPGKRWATATGAVPPITTGPSADHTSGVGRYAVANDYLSDFAALNLNSPCFNLTGIAAPVMTFWLHSHNDELFGPAFENHLSVDVISYPGGLATLDVHGPLGDSGAANLSAAQWNLHAVDLSAFTGSIIQLRFRASTNNFAVSHDQALDDFAIFDAPLSLGQVPRPGKAVLDINAAVDAYGFSLSLNRPGPYVCGITEGQVMTMTFDGDPNNPITVIYGPLSPSVVSFPGGIGQFDVGTFAGPNSLPLSIGTFANAIGWAQSGFPGFPFDALFFLTTEGICELQFQVPNFGIPPGTRITTMQAAIAASAAPFVYMSNAVTITVN